jgi:predicted RNA-binding protein YlqC (UPF0109 family)
MQEFIEFVVKGLVDQPDSVQVASVAKNGMTVYEIQLAPGDAGKIIGRRGSTIQALRSLLQVGAQKRGVRCALELVED